MNDSNQFPPNGFANYDRPIRTRKKGLLEKVFGTTTAQKLQTPFVATLFLLGFGAVFATIVVTSYPESGDEAANVPLIKAEKLAFKESPDSPGGMDVPFQDSTIFMSMQGGELEETAPVENLLGEEEPVDRFAAFDEEEATPGRVESLLEPASGDDKAAPDSAVNEAAPPEKTEEMAAADADEVEPFEIKKIEQTTEKIPPKDLMADAEAQAEKPKEIHAAGSSPETLAFVRSVLDQKDAGTDGSEEAAAIEPASGAALSGAAIQPGDYFVQLASVTSETGAQSEWGKLQKTYDGLLQDVAYRVKRADLDKGTFYRVQAGPMSKDSANAMCDAIKAQKPGGCLVVK